MNHDTSYLHSEYAMDKSQECYDIEARERRKCNTCLHRLNDHYDVPCDSCHEKSDWTQDPERAQNTAKEKGATVGGVHASPPAPEKEDDRQNN